MENIIMYTSSTCPYCKTVKEEFKKENIEFNERLINEQAFEWQEVIDLTGTPTVPTIVYEEQYFVPGRDFANPEQLINILKNFKASTKDINVRTFEQIKTLKFNIHKAFVRMDQLLRQIETKLNIEKDEHKSTN